MTTYFDLGDYRRNISTDSAEALTWFNRGLTWCYGFNQEEAIRCFQKCSEHDPQCALGYWGVALAAGPFYNKSWAWYGEQERLYAIRYCHQFAQQASALKAHASPLEQSLIDALCLKHPSVQADDLEQMQDWNRAYADAMREVYRQYPEDLDVICLFGEALINLTPWKLWHSQSGEVADGSHTLEAIAVFESGLELVARKNLAPHPGLLHFIIHVYEMSPTPEKALPCADQLRELCPEVGHLLHMPSHIDALCGHWQDASDANDRAIAADLRYIELRGTDQFYMISVVHNYDFKIWTAMFLGQYQQALAAADSICALTRNRILPRDEWYLTSTLEGYYAGRAHVLVRFGRWQEICDEDMPDDQILFSISTIYLVYAKAIAHAWLGQLDRAREYQLLFGELYTQVPDWHIIANNPTRDILEVAAAMMNGEVEYHAGEHELGFDFLRQAIKLNDQLAYSEPWPWMHPPRHALGALLLEQGQVEEALLHYEDDLGIGDRLPRCVQHPGNIWALHGYQECLSRLGRDDEASAIATQLKPLLANADIEINSSCCCRKIG